MARSINIGCKYKHLNGKEYLVKGLTVASYDRSQVVKPIGIAIREDNSEEYSIYKINDKEYLAIDKNQHILGGKFVLYQALYDDKKHYLRDLSIFLSKNTSEKYKDIQQEYRFVCIEKDEGL